MYVGTHRCAYTPINGNAYHGSLIWDDTVIDTSAPSRSPEVLLTLHGPPPPAGVYFGLQGLPGTALVLWEQFWLHHILTYLGGGLSSWLTRGEHEKEAPRQRGGGNLWGVPCSTELLCGVLGVGWDFAWPCTPAWLSLSLAACSTSLTCSNWKHFPPRSHINPHFSISGDQTENKLPPPTSNMFWSQGVSL